MNQGFCPYCGRDNPPDYVFCFGCRKRLPIEEGAAPPTVPSPSPSVSSPVALTGPPTPPAGPPTPPPEAPTGPATAAAEAGAAVPPMEPPVPPTVPAPVPPTGSPAKPRAAPVREGEKAKARPPSGAAGPRAAPSDPGANGTASPGDAPTSLGYDVQRRPLSSVERLALEGVFQRTRPGRPGVAAGVCGAICGAVPLALPYVGIQIPFVTGNQATFFGIPEFLFIAVGFGLTAMAVMYRLLDRSWRKDFRAMSERDEIWDIRGPALIRRTGEMRVCVAVGRLLLESTHQGSMSSNRTARAAEEAAPDDTEVPSAQLTYLPPLWYDPKGSLDAAKRAHHPHLNNGVLLAASPAKLVAVSPYWTLQVRSGSVP
jgi:hypothetical protein